MGADYCAFVLLLFLQVGVSFGQGNGVLEADGLHFTWLTSQAGASPTTSSLSRPSTPTEAPAGMNFEEEVMSTATTTDTVYLWLPEPHQQPFPPLVIPVATEVITLDFTTTVYETGTTSSSPFPSSTTNSQSSVSPSSTSSTPQTETTPSSAPTPTTAATETAPSQTYWAAPARFTNLDSFSITNFACGSQNLDIVQPSDDPQMLSQALALDNASSYTQNTTSQFLQKDTALSPNQDSSSILRLLYPAGSINPSNKPVGGADFYARPLALDASVSVTLQYSVYFPPDFAWVLGGKLPGLYGGHTGCSGGNSAQTCFSTRMMWRKDGMGELYLYAPKNKQTQSLCSTPPRSYCNSEYGFSIGRGSFYFKAGGWTNVSQTVRLNSPGQQDGGFLLRVDGAVVLERDDIYYRDSVPDQRPSESQAASQTAVPSPTPGTHPPLGMDGIPVLGGLPDVMLDYDEDESMPRSISQELQPQYRVFFDGNQLFVDSPSLYPPIPSNTAEIQPKLESLASESSPSKPVGFLGLFFSTFFGGSSSEWATPKDQYVYFRDFAIDINY